MHASTSGIASGALDAAPAAGSPPGAALMEMATGYMEWEAIYAATKLGIPDVLKSGPKPTSEIAQACNANEDAVYRVLRALASAGKFSENEPRTFELTADGELLLSDRADSLRPMVLWLENKMHFDTYPELMYAMQTGNTVTEK